MAHDSENNLLRLLQNNALVKGGGIGEIPFGGGVHVKENTEEGSEKFIMIHHVA